jgi:peptide/nickel transport system substrate-binding protein
MLSLSLLLVMIPVASSAGIPNQDTITYATINGVDTSWATDPAGAYDTASTTMLQQVYEPLFMYVNTSLTLFKPMLADSWYGFVPDPNGNGGWIKPLHPSNATELAVLTAAGITPPAGTEEAWLFHIRSGVQWQNSSYGTVKPSDVAYSIQRGMLQDASTGIQWMMYQPLTGAGPANSLDPMFDRNGDGLISPSEYNQYLGPAIENAIGYNDYIGYVCFFLPAPYVPFMQILTQSVAFILNKQWCIERGCLDTDIALSNNPNNYTEFLNHWQPPMSPLMEPSVIGSAWPMMGSGPYRLVVFNTDPHTGFERFQRNAAYWQGWSAHPYATYIVIKTVEEWLNREFQFLSTSSTQCDLTDVPRPDCTQLHIGGNKDNPTLPGISLTKYLQQMIGSLFFCYNVSSSSAFMPKLGGADNATLFSDRDLRLAFMYCLNDSQFLEQYFLGEATQPTTIMPQGTAYYNSSKEVRSYSVSMTTSYFQKAWGGKVWNQGISVKLVYSIGNLAQQTIMTMIAGTVASINAMYGTSLDVTAVGVPSGAYLVEMESAQLPVFVLRDTADYPDPDYWFESFMDPTGGYAGLFQRITYGINATNMAGAWSANASYGPPPYTNTLGEYVSSINNTYVHHIIMAALGADTATREKLYNELMDIYYAEGAGDALYQPIRRHYERDWVKGWIGGYSNNPLAVGPYFYQMWKALPTPSTPVYGVGLDAVHTITPTTDVPYWIIPPTNKTISYNCTAAYTNTTGTPLIIYVAFGLYRYDYYTGERTYVYVGVFTMTRGSNLKETFTWSPDDIPDGLYAIGFRVEPVGATGSEIYPATPNLLAINATQYVYIGDTPPTNPSVPGDLGSRIDGSNHLWAFDNHVTSADLQLFILLFHGWILIPDP